MNKLSNMPTHVAVSRGFCFIPCARLLVLLLVLDDAQTYCDFTNLVQIYGRQTFLDLFLSSGFFQTVTAMTCIRFVYYMKCKRFSVIINMGIYIDFV